MSRLGDVLMVAGAAWAVIASAGALRFDDVYGRMHAATKTTTLALLIVLAGAMTRLGGADAAKLALVGLFVFVTAPVKNSPTSAPSGSMKCRDILFNPEGNSLTSDFLSNDFSPRGAPLNRVTVVTTLASPSSVITTLTSCDRSRK